MPAVTMLTFSAASGVDAPASPRVEAFSVPFNPTELTFQKQMKFAEIAIPGLDAPLQQFVRGEAEKLTLELFFDSTDKGTGLGATTVTTLTDKVFSLARIHPETHAPPVIKLTWGTHFSGDSLTAPFENQRRSSFVGVIESISQKFTLFSPDGVPLRATVNLTVREFRLLDKQIKDLNLNSPDRTHNHTLTGGETLSAVATQEWNRPGEWRRIADENQLDDPRRLRVGTFLTIPVIAR